MSWQSDNRQSDVLKMIVMKSWHYFFLLNRSFDEIRNERKREILYNESRLISVKSSLQMSEVNLKHIFQMLQFLFFVLLIINVACLLIVNVIYLLIVNVNCLLIINVVCLLIANVVCLLITNVVCLLIINVIFLCKMSNACIYCVFCNRLAVIIV